jgi:hypothetical protein
MAVLEQFSRRKRWPTLAAGTALLLLLALLALAVPSRGTTRARLSTPATGTQAACSQVHGPIYAIQLPQADPDVPPGPNREQFTALCRLCHSPRLVLTQPRFPEKKWGEVVHKMAAVYGAPIPPDQEKAIVAYLKAVRGLDY